MTLPSTTRPLNHAQACKLAARRLDEALPAADEVALEAHLSTCPDCTAAAAGYDADRLALRAMAPIEPPRDLWARTRVALEHEHARRPRVARRTPRRWGPVAMLGSGFALILALAIVGPSLIGTNPMPGTIALASPGPVGPSSSQPAVTPIAVDSEVSWVVTKGPQGLSLVTANVTSVCPTGAQPDCPPVAGVSRSLAQLPTTPSSVLLSPTNGRQAIAVAPSLDQAGTSLYLLSVPLAPTATPGASTASGSNSTPQPTMSFAVGPTGTPFATPGSTPSPRATPRATPTLTPIGSPPAVATVLPTAALETPPPFASSGPGESPRPSPSAAATLAIVSNVTLVGGDAAYSSDGQWFAFSARPAGSAAGLAAGPDIYVWQAGWPAAVAITSDHGSVFSGWVGNQILASRVIALPSSTGPASGASDSPGASDGPGASDSPDASNGPQPGTTLEPSPALAPASPDAPSLAPAAGSSGDPQAFGGQPFGPAALSPAASDQPLLGVPAAFLLDPTTGEETQLAGLAGWRPVVDPTGRWVVFWSGTLAFDPVGATWRPFQGQLEMAGWPAVSSAVDAQAGAAAAHALPLASATDWDLRWDQAGQHLGVWIADADNPGLGSLSLLTIDPATGETSSSAPTLLSDAPAARGFALQDGQLVWASPPGQDGTGSRLSILAWTGANAGKTSVQSIESGALIVVH